MNHEKTMKTGELKTDQLQALLAEYPLYLRWGQLLELHARLGLGSDWVVKRSLKAGRIERVRITAHRNHYTRSSVERMVSTENR